jgi:hypothetical protein
MINQGFILQFLDRTRCVLKTAQDECEFESSVAALAAALEKPGSDGVKVDVYDEYGRRVMVVWF